MAKIELNNLSSGYNINTINVNFGKIETEFKDKVVYRNEASPMARDLDVNGFGVINLRNPVSNGDAVPYGFLLNSDAFTLAGLEYKGLWTPVTAYAKNNYVTVSGFVYIAQEAHTSSTDFFTDVSQNKWVVFSVGGGDLVSTNNLSDLASLSNARTNLNVPSRTGENASGSWNINAATATLATLATNATNAANADLVDGVSAEQLVKQTTSTGSAVLPVGTTAQRDASPSTGFFRYNQTIGSFEGYAGAAWVSFLPTSAATTTSPGVVELATDAETQAGVDSFRAITPSNLKSAQIQIGTAIASTSGSTVEFVGLPSWVKRVTIAFVGLSTNGGSIPVAQLGTSGGFVTSGYLSGSANFPNLASPQLANNSAGIGLTGAQAAGVSMHGAMTFIKVSGNTWIATVTGGRSDAGASFSGGGSITLGTSMDRIRLLTTDTFDAGSVNISWE